MAESGLSIKFDDLLLEVAAFLGYGPTPDRWATEQLATLDRHVQSGVRRFYYPPAENGIEAGYQWSFLHPIATLVTIASQATQDLPDDHGRVLGGFHFEQNTYRKSVVQVSEERLRTLISNTEDTGYPAVARVRVRDLAGIAGQRLEVSWWPIPQTAYTFTYRYEAYNGKLSTARPYPLGGMRHAEVLIESCLAVAESRSNDELGIHRAEFVKLLASAIQQDRRLGARYYGHMGVPDERSVIPRHGDTGSTYPISYKNEDI